MNHRLLYIPEILRWADAFFRRHKRWPRRDDGRILGQDLTWCAIDQALKKGHRGLLGGSSLARLLQEHRGVRNRKLLPHFNEPRILEWADAAVDKEGSWPTLESGPIPESPGDTWYAVDKALRNGNRGLPGGSSLAQLLAKHRNVRNPSSPPRLAPKPVLVWADAHKKRHGHHPTRHSGPIPEAPGETWAAIDAAFVAGSRGLAGYGSLARFLAKERGVRNRKQLPRLKVMEIRAWARLHRERTGKRPNHTSGPVVDAPGETWGGIHGALCRGSRGLPRSSLYRVLGRSGAAARAM